MQPTSCCLFLSILYNKVFVSSIISAVFDFICNLFIFSIGTFTSSCFFVCFVVLKSVFGNNPTKF